MGNRNKELSAGFDNCGSTVPLILKHGDHDKIRITATNFLNVLLSSFEGWKVK